MLQLNWKQAQISSGTIIISSAVGQHSNKTSSLNASTKPSYSAIKTNFFLLRDKEETPLYKYDVHGAHPQHWVEPELRDRFFLRVLDGEKALLTISPTHLTDEAVYHCRVDFYQSHSRITHVNLTVVGG